MSGDSVMRDATFCLGTLRPATERYQRKVGRPRVEWATELCKIALRITGSHKALELAIRDVCVWKNVADSVVQRLQIL